MFPPTSLPLSQQSDLWLSPPPLWGQSRPQRGLPHRALFFCSPKRGQPRVSPELQLEQGPGVVADEGGLILLGERRHKIIQVVNVFRGVIGVGKV